MQEGVKGSKILPGASTGLGHELTTPPVPSVPCAGDRDLPTAPARSTELQEQRHSKGGGVRLGCAHFFSEPIIHFPHENNVVF